MAVVLWLFAYILVWLSSSSLYVQAGIPPIAAKEHKKVRGENTCRISTIDTALDDIEQRLSQRQITQAAITELAQIINRYPKNCRAHIIMGNCCDYLGLPEQSTQQYKLALQYGPNQSCACLNLIKALTKTGQWTAANSLLKLAEQRFPNDPQVLLWTGNTSFREGKYREAEVYYLQAMQLAKQPILGLPTALAQERLREGNYGDALKLTEQDLAIDSNFSMANEICGQALMKMGQFECAMPRLKIAFEQKSPSFTVVFDYTRSLIWCGMYSEALIPGLCGLAQAPNDEYRAATRKILNQISIHLSKQMVERAVQELPHYRLVENSDIAHSQMAKLCLDKGLTNLAISQSLVAIHLAPQSAEDRYELALILETYQHNYLEALKYLRQARAIAPNDYALSQHLMRLEDRLTNHKTDWSWQFKDQVFH